MVDKGFLETVLVITAVAPTTEGLIQIAYSGLFLNGHNRKIIKDKMAHHTRTHFKIDICKYEVKT